MRRLPEKINDRGGRKINDRGGKQEKGGIKAFCTKPQFKTFLLSTTFQIEDYTLEGPWNIRFLATSCPYLRYYCIEYIKKRLHS